MKAYMFFQRSDVKNMFKKLSLAFLIVFLFSTTAFSNQPAYKLNEQYTAVRNDVFTKLVENDKLLDVYKEEVSYLKTSLEELRNLQLLQYLERILS